MKNSCNSSFSWCLSATTETIMQISNNLDWDKNQPDNLDGNESCLRLENPKNRRAETYGQKLCQQIYCCLQGILPHFN